MHLRIAQAFALTLAMVVAAGCGETGRSNASGAKVEGVYRGGYPIRIVTTCGMVTDLVSNIAGGHGRVTGIMGEGVDPHLYKPTRNDVATLLDADMVFYSGLMLEGRMGDTFAKVGRSGKPVYAVAEGIDESYLLEPPEFQGHWDPHVWMDVAAWSRCAEFVAEALAGFDPVNAADYRANAAAYRAELARLDEYVRRVIGSIAGERRLLVTAHDAFGYFSRAYEIPVMSAQGITTESEAGVDDINRLVDAIVARMVPAIFVETSVSAKNIRAIVEGVRDKGGEVEIGGSLFSDAMGPAGTYEGTYVGMIDHNATTIARALGGQAPRGGLNGRLAGGE